MDDFKKQYVDSRKNGMCPIHNVLLLEHSKFKNKPTGMRYCPKCRDEAIAIENERKKRQATEGSTGNV